MKNRLAELLRKSQFPLILCCGFLPIPVLICARVAENGALLPWCLLFLAAYLVSALVCLAVPGKWRITMSLAGIALQAVVTYWAMREVFSIFLLLIPLLYTIMLLWGLRLGSWSWKEELPLYMVLAGLLFHVIDYGVLRVARFNQWEFMEPYVPVMQVSFLLFVFLSLQTLNRSSLADAALKKKKVSLAMKRKNAIFIDVFFGISLLIGLIPAIGRFFSMVWKKIADAVVRLILFLMKLLPTDSGGPNTVPLPSEAPEQMEPIEVYTSPFAVFLQEALIILVKIFIAAAFVVLTVFLVKKIWQLLRRLFRQINHYAAAVSEDYQDEVVKTRDFGTASQIRKQFRRRTPRVDERTLDPAQKIRYRYLRLLRRHEDWNAGTTAREKLPPEAASVYEKARYSAHPVTEEDADRFGEAIKHI